MTVSVPFVQLFRMSALSWPQLERLGVSPPTPSRVRVMFFWGDGALTQWRQKKTGNPHLATAGGALGITAAFGAFYCAMSTLWTPQTTLSFIRLPPLIIGPSNV
jgi:hypothetical protein